MVVVSQINTTPSELPLPISLPSRLNATLTTLLVCPVRVRLCVPVGTSHRRMELSIPPLANVRPSGLNATLPTPPVCPVKVCLCVPVPVSHRRIVASQLALASRSPSRLNAMPSTQSVCPVSAYLCTPVAASHKRNAGNRPPRRESALVYARLRVPKPNLCAKNRTAVAFAVTAAREC